MHIIDGEAGVPVPQKTLKTSIHCRGIGLHSGAPVSLTLNPAEPGHGIVFKRTDIDDGRETLIPARWDHVSDTTLCTTISNQDDIQVATIEHLMAALAGAEIDNLLIEIDGPEVPIMDGSAAPFVLLVDCAGTVNQNAPRRAIRVLREVSISDDERSITIGPAETLSIDFEIDFDCPAITDNALKVELVNGTFNHEVSSARTFGFLADVDRLRQMGLARGGSLDNAIIVDKGKVLNEDGLRHKDEFVRHKVLDCIGDLYLAGMPILGAVAASRSGHSYNNKLLHALLSDPAAYEVIELSAHEAQADWRDEQLLAASA